MTTSEQITVYDPVIIKSRNDYSHPAWIHKKFKYEGTVSSIKYNYKNRGAKHLGKEKVIYVSFMDSYAYHNLLLIGSKIFCLLYGANINCYITNILKNNSNIITSLEVSIFDDEDTIRINPIIYKIDPKNIESMLITEKAYQIQKL
uniref:Uncharacterized protein n=1 Tax=viral metagenome TaxID=1070528 RepID=A0A6C0JNK2_9ZZZZ